jgi:putative GTP pyrophosphokinase
VEEKELKSVEEIQEDSEEFKRLMLMYKSALKEIETKINILSDEFQTLYQYNPIEHIKTRIKTPKSIIKKLKKKELDVTYANMVNNLNDVAGIRIICPFIPDIYRLVEMFENTEDIKVVRKRDYIKEPKKSGYSSYHLIVLVPVSFSTGTIEIKAEIQIRTIAMDFWASLEHKIKYKYENEVPKNVSKELIECSKMINKVDRRMSKLGRNTIKQFSDSYEVNNKELNKSSKYKMISKLLPKSSSSKEYKYE